MVNYLEFTPNVSWAKVRVGYEENYDSTVKANILSITSIEVLSTQYTAEYYVDGVLNVNGETVLAFKSSTGNVVAAVKATNTWYPIVKDGEPVTAVVQIEGSETATIELTGNNFQRFAFYTVDGEDGNGWGVSESQEIALTVKKWNAQDFWTGVALSLAAEGLPQDKAPTAYLYNGVKLPALPELVYPHAYIHELLGSYSMIVCESASYAKNGEGTDTVYTYHCVNRKTYYLVNNQWVLVDNTNEGSVIGSLNLQWANTDVLFEDGTLYLAASDPIPVYE